MYVCHRVRQADGNYDSLRPANGVTVVLGLHAPVTGLATPLPMTQPRTLIIKAAERRTRPRMRTSSLRNSVFAVEPVLIALVGRESANKGPLHMGHQLRRYIRHEEHQHHDHERESGLSRLVDPVVKLFSVGHCHDTAEQVDHALETHAAGRRALLISLIGLAVTAASQAVIVAVSGSVALLGDTLHNSADALTAAPLLLAFRSRAAPPTPATPTATAVPRTWPGWPSSS